MRCPTSSAGNVARKIRRGVGVNLERIQGGLLYEVFLQGKNGVEKAQKQEEALAAILAINATGAMQAGTGGVERAKTVRRWRMALPPPIVAGKRPLQEISGKQTSMINFVMGKFLDNYCYYTISIISNTSTLECILLLLRRNLMR